MMIVRFLHFFQLCESTCPEWSQARAAWCQFWIGILSVIVAIILLLLHLLNRHVRWSPKCHLINRNITRISIVNKSGINATDFITLGQPCYVECSLSLLDKIRDANKRGNKYIIKKLIPYIHNYAYYDHIYVPYIDIDDVNSLSNKPYINKSNIYFVDKILNTSFKIYGNEEKPDFIILKNNMLLNIFKNEHQSFLQDIKIIPMISKVLGDANKGINTKHYNKFKSEYFYKWYLHRLDIAKQKEVIKNKLKRKNNTPEENPLAIDSLSSQITRLKYLQRLIIIPFFDKKHKEKIGIIRGNNAWWR